MTDIEKINIETPERALMLAFLVCRFDYNFDEKNVGRGRGTKKSNTANRQCNALGLNADKDTPANKITNENVYGHIDGYFLPKKIDDPTEWGFFIKSVEKIFIPLTAPLSNRPLTAWVLSGKDFNRTTKQTQDTQQFLPISSDLPKPNQTKYQLKYVKGKTYSSLQVKTLNSQFEGISVDAIIEVPDYYNRIFASAKKPASLPSTVDWSWIEILNNKFSPKH